MIRHSVALVCRHHLYWYKITIIVSGYWCYCFYSSYFAFSFHSIWIYTHFCSSSHGTVPNRNRWRQRWRKNKKLMFNIEKQKNFSLVFVHWIAVAKSVHTINYLFCFLPLSHIYAYKLNGMKPNKLLSFGWLKGFNVELMVGFFFGMLVYWIIY